MRDPQHKYASDKRSSEELLNLYRIAYESDKHDYEAIAILHYRGGQEELDIGKRLCESDNIDDCCIGADILAQLGWEDQPFQEESVDILLRLFENKNHDVLYSVVMALGHRNLARSIPIIVRLCDHPDPIVRSAVASALGGFEDERAVSALIILGRDEDYDTRNWAMFALGSLIDYDSAELREALVEGLKYPDDEIRGEALVGLSIRKDSRVIKALQKELESDIIGMLCLEAAEELADPELLPALIELQSTWKGDEEDSHTRQIARAIEACTGSIQKAN